MGRSDQRARWRVTALISAAVMGLAAGDLHAASWLNTSGSGNQWNVPGNWSGGVPNSSVSALFNLGPTYTVLITAGAQAKDVTVSAGAVTASLGGNTLTVAQGLILNSGLTLSGNGALAAAGDMDLADGSTASLTVTSNAALRTGATLQTNANIGASGGTGTLTVQSSASWTHTGNISLGDQFDIDATGVLNISSATVNCSNVLTVWSSGSTLLNMTGGTLNVTNGLQLEGELDATGAGSNLNATTGGILELADGDMMSATSLTINGSANTLVIFPAGFNTGTDLAGYNNASGVTGFGGASVSIPVSKTILGSATVGQHVNVAGTLTSRGNLLVLDNGINVTGSGSATVDGLRIDDLISGMSSTGSLTVNTDETIGAIAPGAFAQSSGTHTITGALYDGYSEAGSYTLSGTGILNAGGDEYVGTYLANGTFTQTGGTNNCGGYLIIDSFGASATYSMSAGNLNVALDEDIGFSDSSTHQFIQTGGTHHISGSLYVGFTNAGQFSLSGPSSLTVDISESIGLSGGSATFTQSAGTHTITGPLHVSDDFSSTGTFNLHGGSLFATALYVHGGGVFNYNAGSLTPGDIYLNGNGLLKLSAGANKALKATSISALDTAKLDVTDNKAVFTSMSRGSWNGSNYDGVEGLVKSGRNGGGWNGRGIITSMSAAALPNPVATLAVATASEVGKTTFGGASVSTGDVLVMYTWLGDANLSGKVDADDYFRIDSNYAKTANSFKTWSNGDFNFDGLINGDDYALIDAGFSGQGPPIAGGVSAVPEPAGAGLILAIAGVSTIARRRRTMRR